MSPKRAIVAAKDLKPSSPAGLPTNMTDTTPDGYEAKTVQYFHNERREMLPFVPPEVRNILEVGCGTGAFGAMVKARQTCRYTGIEFVPSQAAQAREKLDEVLTTDIESSSLPFAQGSFDCLVFNDVLEHLVDPWDTLTRLTRLLVPGGYLVISIPNVRFSEVVKDLVVRDRWEYQAQGVLDRTHLRFFTRASVCGLVESAGAEVLRIEGINGIKYAWRLKLLNFMLLGALSSMRFPQYAVQARLR